jgi:D-glycero-D-manno-heptose 1,7-bisphosphate phosphatase
MTKAIFLDRDGVLNRELGHYVTSVDDFEVLPTVPAALLLAAKSGYLLIIISNQGGVAKGLYTMEQVLEMHAKLEFEANKMGVHIAEGYYCPHHPDVEPCLCRKPQSLMVQQAIERFDIDPKLSFMIGDKQRDMEAAEGAGVKGVLMPSNTNLLDVMKRIL